MSKDQIRNALNKLNFKYIVNGIDSDRLVTEWHKYKPENISILNELIVEFKTKDVILQLDEKRNKLRLWSAKVNKK